MQGVDDAAVSERLERLGEAHWAYMDGYVDGLVARGPTLSPDGADHTGSIHVLSTPRIEDAQRFAFEEPYWLAGVYASVSVTRFHNALPGTMWDRPAPPPGSTSSLVIVSWHAQPSSHGTDPDVALLQRLADTERLVFGGLLISDDAATSIGLAAALDVGVGEAAALVDALTLPEPSAPILACRWQRGGRNTE